MAAPNPTARAFRFPSPRSQPRKPQGAELENDAPARRTGIEGQREEKRTFQPQSRSETSPAAAATSNSAASRRLLEPAVLRASPAATATNGQHGKVQGLVGQAADQLQPAVMLGLGQLFGRHAGGFRHTSRGRRFGRFLVGRAVIPSFVARSTRESSHAKAPDRKAAKEKEVVGESNPCGNSTFPSLLFPTFVAFCSLATLRNSPRYTLGRFRRRKSGPSPGKRPPTSSALRAPGPRKV